jgi:5'-deoxynucleotidase YfbR-like HD superfamily hydrolase
MADRGEWFLSVKGRQLYPFDMRPEDVDIEEIAHALSMLCRFNGHCREFYSVAQHSVLIAQALPPDLALVGLLHDATEAYCGDMIRPLKRSMPAYREVEDRIWSVIAERFGLPQELPPDVKEADTRMLQTERRDLLAPHRWRWMEDQIADDTALPYDFTIEPLSASCARRYFLALFKLFSKAVSP